MAETLDNVKFAPYVARWFARRFGEPSPIQRLGWPAIAGAAATPRHDVLLCAPTGSGKTLAAFLWAINCLSVDAQAGALRDGVAIVYVSPLKALANDVRINLDEPLAGIREEAQASGVPIGELRAGLRTGDTPAHQRAAMLKQPPHILVTTPESLFIMLTSPRFRVHLNAVSYVIIDEIHALAPDKRGPHLALTLERLDWLVRRNGKPRPIRIGLSATLNPIERLAQFMAGFEVMPDGARHPRPVRIVKADNGRPLDLAVAAMGPELGPLATHEHWEALYDELARLIGEHRTTLVFTLSRRLAERIALNLQHRLGANAVMAHHGSLARRERLEAESRLKRGELRALVATASLELGIDVGAVDLVCQIDSPRSISTAVQRIGRAGHRLGAVPKGRFYALTIDDLIECAAVIRAIRAGVLDEVEIPRGCLDVAAQQIVAIATEAEEVSEKEILELLRGAYHFGDLTPEGLSTLLAEMAANPAHRIRGAEPKIFHDSRNRKIRARRNARLAVLMSGGTIPENGNYDVVVATDGRKVGDVEEDFAQESVRGDIFALGSNPWKILGISRNRLMVEPAPGMMPSVPFWQTEATGRSQALSAAVCDLRRELDMRIRQSGIDQAARWLERECSVDGRSARAACEYLNRGVAALGVVPDKRTIVIERFFDGLGGTQIVIHCPLGMRFNRGFGFALRKRLCQSFDFEIQASAIDDAVLLALNSRHSFPLEDLFAMLPAQTLSDICAQALLDAPMFETRFRHVATRALAVMRTNTGRRVPAWIQRLRAQELMTALFPARQACFENRPPHIDLPGHFIVAETMRECLEESTDLPRLVGLMRDIEHGVVKIVTVDSVAPSVFAHRILLAWDFSFIDDGERANRRSRTVALNRAMVEDVLRSDDVSELLDPEAIAEVEREAKSITRATRARGRDELLEIVRRHGFLPVDDLAERVNGDSTKMIAALEAEGRLMKIAGGPDHSTVVVAAEDRDLLAAAWDSSSGGERNPMGSDAARRELVRRVLVTSGPVTIEEVARRLRLQQSEVEQALISLEASGVVFRGRFARRDDSTIATWCERGNLERIHRLTLGRLRREIEPASDDAFVRFRVHWFGIRPTEQSLSDDPLVTALETLEGFGFAPAVWERSILPARIPDYRPEMLDRLFRNGEFVWLGVTQDSSAEFPEQIVICRRRATFVRQTETAEWRDPIERLVFDALKQRGALYLDEISELAAVSERDALRALWRLAAAGVVSNDSFEPLRLYSADAAALRSISQAGGRFSIKRRAAVNARISSSAGGRWFAPQATRIAEHDPVRAAALAVLRRNGIVSREILSADPADIRWSELSFALRRMEYAGEIRRGYFIHALAGEQYALPKALKILTALRSACSNDEKPIALSAVDPASPYGTILPSQGVSRDPNNLVVLNAGHQVAGLAGTALKMGGLTDHDSIKATLTALIELRKKLIIEQINDKPALESEWLDLMASAGFHSNGRALVYDGLPGPRPGGVQAQRRRAS